MKKKVDKHHEGILMITFVIAVVGLFVVIFNSNSGNTGGEAIRRSVVSDCEPDRVCREWRWINQTTSECVQWDWVNNSVCTGYDLVWDNNTNTSELVCVNMTNSTWGCVEYGTVLVKDCKRYGYVNRCKTLNIK